MKNLDEIKFTNTKRQQAGMTVPEGFFENFQKDLEAKIDALEASKNNKSQAPVVQMNTSSRRFYRWIAAACVVFVVGFSFTLFNVEDSSLLNQDSGADQIAQTESVDEIGEIEDLVVGSISDYDLYDYYCEL